MLQPHVAEIWRLTYVTPPPTSPRTFVVLLLSRELVSAPHGERCFMNSECRAQRTGERSDGAGPEWRVSSVSVDGAGVEES